MPVKQKAIGEAVELSRVTEKQYAAICFRHVPGSDDPIQVLLITCPDTGRWIIPKGRSISGAKPHEVVQRVAWDVAGIKGRSRAKPCGYYTYRTQLGQDGSKMSVVQVHLLNVMKLDREFPQKGRSELRWFSVAAAAATVCEPDLKWLIANIREPVNQFLSLGQNIW